MLLQSTEWFDSSTSGMIGAIVGSSIGVIVGGIGGPLAGTLAPRGKAKAFVIGFFIASLVIGVILTLIGIGALVMGQPYHVWFVFLLPGVLTASLTGSALPMLHKHYAVAEQRKLDAEELRRA